MRRAVLSSTRYKDCGDSKLDQAGQNLAVDLPCRVALPFIHAYYFKKPDAEQAQSNRNHLMQCWGGIHEFK